MTEALEFPRAEATSLRMNVLGTLRSYILTGKLRPGDRLLENGIAQQMGVSRAPVREAIRYLEQEGLVESAPHRGTYVAQLSADEIEQIYHVRALLEGYAVRRAVAMAAADDHLRLKGLLEAMRLAAAARDFDGLVASDLAFHEEILRLSGSRAIQRIWSTMDAIIRNRTYSILRRSWRADIADYTVASHEPLVAAFFSGDADKAQAALEQHIFETRDLSQTAQAEPAAPAIDRQPQ
ncbi:MAG: GntR family transcriptional regulator [Chloroflexota bacterium]